MELNGHTIEITHPDKVLFPDDGITKAEFIDYYRKNCSVHVAAP
jgi:bifunctional non-homologous end joining protein LigD